MQWRKVNFQLFDISSALNGCILRKRTNS